MARTVGGISSVVISIALASTSGCSDNTGPSALDSLPDIAGLTISAPVAGVERGAATFAAVATEGTLVYVSLAPKSTTSGRQATIRNMATGQSITADVLNGGFDPIALPASIGDTLIIDVADATGVVTNAVRVVKPRRPPVVVRTDPPPQKKDVPLNAIIVVVFSEPIDPATLGAGSIALLRGTTSVPGTVRLADTAQLRAEFHPDELLDPDTDYQLVLSEAIRGVNGLPLDSRVTVPFATGETVAGTHLIFASVSAGFTHSCGVTYDDTAYCWGDNSGGALGNGTTTNSATPVRVAGLSRFKSVIAGFNHTCGVTRAGALYCWGGGMSNLSLPLGSGPTPTRVGPGITFATVSVGQFYTCGVATDGTAYCWGESGLGQLGDGTAYGATPGINRVAGGHTFDAVSAGNSVSCGLTIDGEAYCWGSNALGGLGTGTTVSPEQCRPDSPDISSTFCTVPVKVAGGLTFRDVRAKIDAACGLTTSGAAYCWGSDLNDGLGFGGVGTKAGPDQCPWSESTYFPCSRVPLAVPGSPQLVSLTAADDYTCGLTPTGIAYCWGYPQEIGDLNSGTAPAPVPGGLTFVALSTGRYSACGLTTDGVAYCWGFNNMGQLGDGTTTNSSVPVMVAGQRP
ncbi:MAG: Ig-like domain-containing protein [Gemmatimonadaceae bacterium]